MSDNKCEIVDELLGHMEQCLEHGFVNVAKSILDNVQQAVIDSDFDSRQQSRFATIKRRVGLWSGVDAAYNQAAMELLEELAKRYLD